MMMVRIFISVFRTSMMDRRMYTSLGVFLLTLVVQLNGAVVKLPAGQINGTVGQSRSGRLFQAFYGIPFAEPPVGELRFKPPVATKPWSGIKDAFKFSAKCLQDAFLPIFDNDEKKSEDCLYLNVFVPDEIFKPSGRAAVMVWIHGGSFTMGSAHFYAPEYFMDKNVILVTINYRLGVLGFFGMNNDIISGNFGLKDQTMALLWVKNNIASFGGDPGNVTLMGESAGAASVHLHMFSPLSKGLFQKAILQSGSAFAQWPVRDNKHSIDFLDISGCSCNDSAKSLKCLQSLPADKFVELERNLMAHNHGSNGIVFTPIIESKVNNQPFLTQRPTPSTYQSSVPWICGITSGEGALLVVQIALQKGDTKEIEKIDKDSVAHLIRPSMALANGSAMATETVKKVVDFYYGSNNTGSNAALKIVEIATDYAFLYPLIKGIMSSRERQFIYLYDHRGSFSLQDIINSSTDLGVCHADELFLMFRLKTLEPMFTPEDKLVSETLIKFWTNFAIFGDPNGLSGDKLWKPTGPELPIEYLRIKSNSTMMEKNLFKERFEFWNSILH